MVDEYLDLISLNSKKTIHFIQNTIIYNVESQIQGHVNFLNVLSVTLNETLFEPLVFLSVLYRETEEINLTLQ